MGSNSDSDELQYTKISSSRSNKPQSILKSSLKKNDNSDDEDRKYNKYDDNKRFGSPIGSSRSVSNKPPTGRLQPLSSTNNRSNYEYDYGTKKSYEENRWSKSKTKNSDSDDENDKKNKKHGRNDSDNDSLKQNSGRNSKASNRKNDSDDEFDRKKSSSRYTSDDVYGKKNSSRFNKDSDDDSDKKKKSDSDEDDKYKMNSARSKLSQNKRYDDDDFDSKKKPVSKYNNYDDDSDTKKKTTSKFSSYDNDDSDTKSKFTKKTSLVKRDDSEEDLRSSFRKSNDKFTARKGSDDDSYKKTTSYPTSNRYGRNDSEDDIRTSHKPNTLLSSDQEDVNKEYSKTLSRYDDDFKYTRGTALDKKSSYESAYDRPLSYRNSTTSNSMFKNEGSLSAREKNSLYGTKTTSLDRLNTSSAYNYTSGLGSSSKTKYSSSNNIYGLDNLSDKGTLNTTNLTIKEAKNRSYLVGSLSASGGKGLLSSDELDKHLIDRKARVLIVTWNMADQKQIPDKLEELVLPDNIQTMPDLYAIGTQEFALNQKDWEIKLQEIIGPTHVKIASNYQGNVGLTIFIKRELIWFCSIADTEIINLRAIKVPGKTKASMLISFQLFGTLMCFICSHFESGDENFELRVENYRQTISSITLPKSIEIKSRQTPAPKSASKDKDGEQEETPIVDNTANFDCVFWFGDLNFRNKKEREKVIKKVSDVKYRNSNNYEDLLNHDELHQLLNKVYNASSSKAFDNFNEPKIMFEPTYKYNINSDDFDTEKCRIPSYCDRILYRTKHKNAISCSVYDSVKDIKSSDHRPVYALLEVNIRPGTDKVPLSFGEFDRDIYVAGYKKRQMHRALDIDFPSSAKAKKKFPGCPIQ